MTRRRSAHERETALAVLRCLAESSAGQTPLVEAGAIPVFVTKVRRGTDEQKTTSAGALRGLAAHLENHAAIASAGGIDALVGLANDGSAAQREEATGALLRLAENKLNHALIVAAGGIDVLMACVQEDPDSGKEDDKAGLEDGKDRVKSPLRDEADGRTSERDTDCKDAVTDVMAPIPANIQQYVELVRSGKDGEKARAASALFDLSASEANHDAIVAADGVPALVELLQSGTQAQKTSAAGAHMHLAKNAAVQPVILAAGGARELVRSMGSGEMGTFAAAALVSLAAHAPSHAAIVDADGVDALIRLSLDTNRSLQLLSAMGLSVLARTPTVAKSIYSRGGVPVLLRMVRRGTPEQRTHASRALRRMAKAGSIDPKTLASDGEPSSTSTGHGENSVGKRAGEELREGGSPGKRIKREL